MGTRQRRNVTRTVKPPNVKDSSTRQYFSFAESGQTTRDCYGKVRENTARRLSSLSELYAAVFGCNTPEPTPTPSWLTDLSPASLGTQVPKLNEDDQRMMKMDGQYVSMLGWEILLSQLQYIYDALISRRKGCVYGGSLRPFSPLVLWAMHCLNLILNPPHNIRWHVIRDHCTAWIKWHEACPPAEKSLVAMNTPAWQIKAYDDENVRMEANANRCAIIEYTRIRTECQE